MSRLQLHKRLLSALAVLAVAALPACRAQNALPFTWPPYAGVESFIRQNFSSVEPIEAAGGTFQLIVGAQMLGMAIADTSFLLFSLEPCTILQPHIHPHAEFAFPLSGKVTFSLVWNNNTVTDALENTQKDVGPGGFAILPTGALHITQNEHCEPATIVAVFGSANPSAAFYPFTEGAMPANTLASFYGGTVTKQTAQTPFFTAKLAGCSCP